MHLAGKYLRSALLANTLLCSFASSDDVPGGELLHSQFATSARGTMECPTGYEHITTVEECVKAAQDLKIIAFDYGDGHAVSLNDTATMEAWVSKRQIASNDPLGFNKPHGCYADHSIKIVSGLQRYVTTIWVNHNYEVNMNNHNYKLSGMIENSAPMCKLTGAPSSPHPFILQKWSTKLQNKGVAILQPFGASIGIATIPLFVVVAGMYIAFVRRMRQPAIEGADLDLLIPVPSEP